MTYKINVNIIILYKNKICLHILLYDQYCLAFDKIR